MDDPTSFRSTEMEWLSLHKDEYRGEWVVIECTEVIARGKDGVAVYKAARDAGIAVPFLVHIPEKDPDPWGGW